MTDSRHAEHQRAAGGEPAAIALIDACVRLLPGVIGAPQSLAEESFQRGLLEYPHYTRPANWRGRAAPANIAPDTAADPVAEVWGVLYRITRAERRLLAPHAAAIGGGLASPVTLVELGGGNGEKLVLLIEPLVRRLPDLRVALVDLSATALDLATRTLGRFRGLGVTGHQATYEDGLRRVAHGRSGDDTMMVADDR